MEPLKLIKLLLFSIFVLILNTNAALCQEYIKYENDTLFTSCGFKIYAGQTLVFSKGSGNKENFKYVKIKGRDKPEKLRNKTITVSKISNYHITIGGKPTVTIKGLFANEQGESKSISFVLFFEQAIYGNLGLPPELIVPDEYKAKNK